MKKLLILLGIVISSASLTLTSVYAFTPHHPKAAHEARKVAKAKMMKARKAKLQSRKSAPTSAPLESDRPMSNE